MPFECLVVKPFVNPVNMPTLLFQPKLGKVETKNQEGAEETYSAFQNPIWSWPPAIWPNRSMPEAKKGITLFVPLETKSKGLLEGHWSKSKPMRAQRYGKRVVATCKLLQNPLR